MVGGTEEMANSHKVRVVNATRNPNLGLQSTSLRFSDPIFRRHVYPCASPPFLNSKDPGQALSEVFPTLLRTMTPSSLHYNIEGSNPTQNFFQVARYKESLTVYRPIPSH